MRVLVLTHVFPSAADPLSAPFNRQQLVALSEHCEVEVWGTIPWFPGKRVLMPGERKRPSIPEEERIHGLRVQHPRTPYIPRIGHAASVPLYVGALAPALRRERGRVDVVLGSWAYPDGAAAVALGRVVSAPVVVKLHGSDLNVVAQRRAPRAVLKALLPRAERVVAVSRQLAGRAEALGVARECLHIVYNGIDSEQFCPKDRQAARKRLNLEDDVRWILYCGHLKRSKGIDDLVAAYGRLCRARSDVRLAIVGEGPDRRICERAAAAMGDRIHIAGAQPHAAIPDWMAACDVLALPSWHEGTPNVVLEALSSGRRVVATDVGGTADLVHSECLGELVPPGAPDAFAKALSRAASAPYDPYEVARVGAAPQWRDSAAALCDVLALAMRRGSRVKGSALARAPGFAPEGRASPATPSAAAAGAGGRHGTS